MLKNLWKKKARSGDQISPRFRQFQNLSLWNDWKPNARSLLRVGAKICKIKIQKFCEKHLPILVESTFALNIDMLSPNSFQGSQTSRSLNVTDHSNAYHGWSFKNSHSFNNLPSTTFATWSVDFTNNMRHTSFEAQKGSQMTGFLGIILGKSLHLTTMTLGPFLGIESHGSMARSRELTMRL